MCNPRKVVIELTRKVEEAWRESVTETAAADTLLRERGRLTTRLALGEEMGEAALETLARVLAGEFPDYPAWEREPDGRFRREMEPVVLYFDPATAEMTVEARLTESLSAEAHAVAEACGFTAGEVAVEGVGRYYDDGWGGRTRDGAEAEALAHAERQMDAAVRDLHRRTHAEELAAARERARNQAEAEAGAELARLAEEARETLRGRLDLILARSRERAFHVMNRAVGEAYRQTLRRLAEENGRVVSDQRSGSVIQMELVLD